MKHLAAFLLATLSLAPALAPWAHAQPLTISYSEKVGDNLPLWIARDAGYFKQNGIDAKLLFLPAQEGVPALLGGQVDMAAIGGSDIVSAAAQGVKLKYVATFSPVYTFQLWAQPQFATPGALKGQRVGTTSTTGSVYISAVLALQKLGLATSDVAITPLGALPNLNAALLAGSIAAAPAHPPTTYTFKQHGLVDLVDLAKDRVPAVNTGLAVPAATIQAHPETVQRVVIAIVQAIHREKTDRAFTVAEMRQEMGVTDPAIADYTYDFYANEVVQSVPMPEVNQLQAAKDALGKTVTKARAVDLQQLIDQSFVAKATVPAPTHP
jgi:NitT/TauT family transport system substrate-binding protein